MPFQSLPALYYPFEGRHSPYEQEIEATISEWIDQYPFLTEEERIYYKKCQFGMITSCFYPNANYQALRIGAKLTLLLFIHDDHTDNFSPDELRSFLLQSESIMAGHKMPHDYTSILQEFTVFSEELKPLVPDEWMQRWMNNLNYFYEGMIIERYFMDAGQYPSVRHYMFIREHLIGMYIFQDIIELYLSSFIPYEVLSHPYIRKLRQIAARIIAWCNDYYSAEKELRNDQKMNLVLVIQQERQCKLEQAYMEAINIHEEEVKAFMELREAAPDFGPYSEMVEEYIQNIQLMFNGNQLWHICSGRYNNI